MTGQQFLNVLYGALATIIATGLPILIYWMKMQFAALRAKDSQQQTTIDASRTAIVDLHSVVSKNANALPVFGQINPDGSEGMITSGTKPLPLPPSMSAPPAQPPSLQAFAPPAPGSTQRV